MRVINAWNGDICIMGLFIATTYVILSGVIIYLLILISRRKADRCVEVRDTILATEELERHAIEIARSHPVMKSAKSLHWLVRRLNSNYSFIVGIYKALNIDTRESFPSAPAAEWLLDNFYIIEEQVKLIRRNLSRGRYSKLPVLKEGYLKGYPRVYAIALEMVAHSNGGIDDRIITTFIHAYQTQTMLSIAELWAFPIMLRIAVLESIRNVCEKIHTSRIEWHKAEELASHILTRKPDEQEIKQLLDDQFSEGKLVTSSFTEHLVQRLRKAGKGNSSVTALMDAYLEKEHSSIEKMTAEEHQMQAEMQVAIGNSITGLRLISELDWSEMFEALSHVEQILRKDPSGVYGQMDFESRDYYRHGVEKLARAFNVSEIHVTNKAIGCAKAGAGNPPQDHVGYYLIGKGRETLVALLEKSSKRRWVFSFASLKKPKRLYAAIILSLTAFLVCFFTYYALSRNNAQSFLWPFVTVLLTLIPCSEFAISVTNTIFGHVYRPTMMPKLELKDGIPNELAAFVIVPTLLTSPGRAEELLRQLEVYFLANREKNLYFALVGDFKDAPSQTQEKDEGIVSAVLNGVEELNGKYSADGHDIFFYVHRKRSYSKSQDRWMGWERKRGAVLEFNRLLRGETDTGFNVISGDVSQLSDIRYVITLDADSNLPMGTAKRLIGTMAHPLNKACVDEETETVTSGYGLLQPRICVSIAGANRSLFTKIFAGQGGIDPYTTAVSDIYQDIFDEGIFTGKGIYEVDVYRRVLENRIPDNKVLSHDLLEGCYLRAGLASDIELVDSYPSGYQSYTARQHRWVRGDWQLLPWLAGRVEKLNGNKVKNTLSGLSKWKIADNLRRSLIAPSLLLLLIAGIGFLPGSNLVWIGFVILVSSTPLTTGFLNVLLSGNLLYFSGKTNSTVITGIRAAFYQSVLMLMLIPHQTWIMADAVIRTIYRTFISHKNMLEWVTAADVEASAKNSPGTYLRKMWFVIPAAVALAGTAALSPEGLGIVAVIVTLWLLSPWVAYWISKPIEKRTRSLSIEDNAMLRRMSRKTWRYFEDFAGETDHFLPPDNYQEDPPKGVAHRTSPTNIGLLLISILSAADMGFIGWKSLVERLEKTISTIEKMEKWKGHLYNWYDTVTLETLRPIYVSTVDSGNLVGYLIVVREGLKEFFKKKIPEPNLVLGLKDTLDLVCKEERTDIGSKLRQALSEPSLVLGEKSGDLRNWLGILKELTGWCSSLAADHRHKSSKWLPKLTETVEEFANELIMFYPYLERPELLNILEPAPSGTEAIFQDVSQAISNIDMYKPATPSELLKRYQTVIGLIGQLLDRQDYRKDHIWAEHAQILNDMLREAQRRIEGSIQEVHNLTRRISVLIDETEFTPLFDHKRMLFSIGYNVEEGRLSKSYYDLLASEARQASYIAIARGEVDRRHWMRMGRKLTAADGGKGLVSWTGTMFEYLMPLLIMRNYENTLFDETYSFAVRVQKKYGKQHGIPWGISESGYSALDFNLNYQYKAFGVPELGLKRGLANDMVTAPYASMLALNVSGISAVENLKQLADLGADGLWGYYEAIDFTPSRLDKDASYYIVKSYMAHHQGMSLAAMNNFFNSNILQERFHSDPVINSAELLLQEKIPEKVLYTREFSKDSFVRLKKSDQTEGMVVRTFGLPGTLPPNVNILSNGVYNVMVTDGGSGYSKNSNMDVTRWEADYFTKNGFYIFIKNVNSNVGWSATLDPLDVEPEKYRVVFSPDKAEYVRRDGNLETHLEVTVSAEDNAEVRMVSVTNHSNHIRIVEFTSYLEAVLAPGHEDAAHPAFSKLFVKTEFVPQQSCLLAVRKQRTEEKKPLWLMHTMVVDSGSVIGDLQYETDRMKFIGRNRNISNPKALEPDQPLSNSEGSVLDPVMSLRRRVEIAPGHTVKVVYTVAVAHTRQQALELAEKYNDYRTSRRVFELSWTRSQVENRYLGLENKQIEFYLELIPFILYDSPLRREHAGYIANNTGAQQELWPFGISGDIPVILVEVNEMEDMEMVEWAIKGHEFWKMKGLMIDLVLVVNKKEGYSQPLNDQIRNIIAASHARESINHYGGVFIRNTAEMDQAQVTLLYTVAKIVIKDSIEALKGRVKELRILLDRTPPAVVSSKPEKVQPIFVHQPANERKLLFFNGIGGFSADGKEYVIRLPGGSHTPAPWSNIISNKKFGFLVTESGGGYTWAENSREFKLTPWSNDPVTDWQGEVFYMCDTHQKCHWTLTPSPAGDNELYTIRHGHGYSIFEHNSHGLSQSLTMFAALDSPVKICLVTITNITGRKRDLTITYYTRPVLGVDENQTSPYIVTWRDERGVLFAENKYNNEFRGRVAFLSTNIKDSSVTGDRISFIGQSGDLSEPMALTGETLGGVTGAGIDPCAAIMGNIKLEPEEEVSVVFLLGSGENAKHAAELAARFSDIQTASDELDRVREYWRRILEAIQVHTPDDSFDVMINGWFMYQTIACRIWARSGYYQAGGAYGFRDQLQDSMSLLNTWPLMARDQILLHASRQFEEGDVQHWWHMEGGKGIRTRYSDDLLWLAYVTAEYIEKTADTSILYEQVPFLKGSILAEGNDEKYEQPQISDKVARVYEHCTLAIDRSLATGPHGLPLIGSGDWNDGMNTVGNKGMGESVWLGWFLISILKKFIPVCRLMEDFDRAQAYREATDRLQENMERNAWDGSWYRRAYFDDGTPLGSVHNSECMIDSISQSWSVISGAAKPHRMEEAMDAVQKYLVDSNEGIIKLLTPPFDKGDLHPGYIKGYVPGVRENGGQYTHAATWAVMAFALLGKGDKASELFHMLNPVNHTRTELEYSRYKTEPYVIAADVYSVLPHTGRGGWTWYTGAAGWLYKVGLENIAGFRKKGDRLHINPCIPKNWDGFEIDYRMEQAVYHIQIKNPDSLNCGVSYIAVDGKPCLGGFIILERSGFHRVEVIMGTPPVSDQDAESNPESETYVTGSSIGNS